jgi:alpha-D-ribose 1-methylphosphonate 5-triphosphate synthase subunit PhnL
MTKPEHIFFRDLSGKDHTLKKSLYRGHRTLNGQVWVQFGKGEFEICQCELKRVFMAPGFLGPDYFSSKS